MASARAYPSSLRPVCSFLVPVRDGAATLGAAIESALAQSVADLEVVVVDDGSEDGSQDIARSHARRDPRVRVLARPRCGLVPALNAGLRECRAPFVARLDADDVAAPERLAEQLPLLTRIPELAVVDGRVRFFRDDAAVPPGMLRYGSWVNAVLAPEDFDRAWPLESPVVHPAATFRRDAVDSVGGYREGDFPEDYDLWLRLELAAWRFRKVPDVLVRMRDRPERLTRSSPRYRPAAFRRLAQEWIARRALPDRSRVVVWGAGRGGGPWLRWLHTAGVTPLAAVDIDPRKIGRRRHGVPILAPADLPALHPDLCLVAVGSRGARELIRDALTDLFPAWREGRHWWHVAC